MKKYRVIAITNSRMGRVEYWPQVYKRLWYAPWKFGWVNAYSWEDSFPGVPYFSSLLDVEKWFKFQMTPDEIKVIYPEDSGVKNER